MFFCFPTQWLDVTLVKDHNFFHFGCVTRHSQSKNVLSFCVTHSGVRKWQICPFSHYVISILMLFSLVWMYISWMFHQCFYNEAFTGWYFHVRMLWVSAHSSEQLLIKKVMIWYQILVKLILHIALCNNCIFITYFWNKYFTQTDYLCGINRLH